MIKWLKKLFLYSLIGIFIFQISAFAALINPTHAKAAAPPENPILILKGGATYTKITNIGISITDDASAVAWLVRENPAIPSPAEVNVTPEPTTFDLSAGDGLKTVYAWVKNAGGEINVGVTSSLIILDTTDPNVSALNIQSPSSPSTDNPVISFTWQTATDITSGLDKYDFWFGRGSTKDFERELDVSATSYTLSLAEQTLLQHGKTYHAKIRAYDKAGNVSSYSVNSTTVLFQDNQFYPGELGFQINGGADFTNSSTVHLAMSASDYWTPVEMRISEDNTFAGTAWIDFAPTYDFDLSALDGLKTVYIQFRDAGGNKSIILPALITLDTTAPTSGPEGLLSAPGDVFGKIIDVTYDVSDATSGMDYLMLFYQRGGGDEQSVRIDGPFSAHIYSLDISGLGEGIYTLRAEAFDKAGNSTVEVLGHGVNVTFPAPVSPGNLQVKFCKDEATLSWDSVANADFYQVRYTQNGVTSDWFQTTETSIKILVKADSDYTFEVRAFGNGKEGLISKISVHTPVAEKVTRAVGASSPIASITPKAEAAPSQAEVQTPETPAAPVGEIKGGETQANGTDWTKIVITIAILIIAAGIGTAGWYAYQWWVAGDISEAPPVKEDKEEKEDKEDKTKKRQTRW